MFCLYYRRKGVALFGVLCLTIVFAGIGISLLLLSVANSDKTQTSYKLTRALMCAETGLEQQLSVLNDSDVIAGEGLDDLTGGHHGATFTVATTAWWMDGEDNDGNGWVDDEVEDNYFTLESVGVVGNIARRVRATVRKGRLGFPDVYGAITLYNPMDENGDVIPGAIANFSGNPPRVSGRDSDLPVLVDFDEVRASDVVIGSGEGPDVLGVAVHDDQSVVDVSSELGNKEDRVDGVDPTGIDDTALEDLLVNGGGQIGDASVANTNSFDPLNANDIYSLAQELGAYASGENVHDETNWPDGGSTLGTVDAPQITVLRPSDGVTAQLNGNVSGSGILVIDGHVRLSGTFNYAGLVIITSNGLAEVELMGTPLVMGAIIAANPDPDTAPGNTVLDLRGTADVYYSTEALGLAEQVCVGKTQVLAMNEF